MKNIGFLCLLAIGFLIPGKAQITITNAVFPAVGDTLFYALDDQPDALVMTAPGGGQQWDFTNLQPSLAWEEVFLDAGAGSVSGSFPTAGLVSRPGNGTVEAYLEVSAQEVSLLGFSGGSSFTLGLGLIPRFNPPIVQSRAPVQFFDIHQISSGLLLPFLPDILPGVNQLPVMPDSLRIRVAINRLDVVDAWGTLAIPGGAFDVLRQKRTEYRETRLDAKIPPLGWLDITDVAIQNLQLSSLGVDTTVTYQFLNGQSKEPIAVVTTDNTQLRAASVQYKNMDTPTGTKKEEGTISGLAIFPNPAEGVLQIRAGNLAGGDYTVRIYSLPGQEVFRKACMGTSGQLQEELNISSLEKGVYVCKISSGNGQTEQVLFVKR
ncbi:MAG: T9SS type A sorting domain-containing protein [Phaeodactylibacter sp.]|nr:T9SS type A sorting domain-containing protein [Phaeodactylibacter sp.]